MAIEGLIGRPGAGKTYELTRRALAEADRDRLVFSNYPIAHPNIYMFEPEQLLDLPPGLVVIDEAHLWFPARMALQLPMEWLAGMSQTRKKGWDLIWSAQHESRVDKVIRDVTDWLWLSTAWFSHNGHPLVFAAACWEPEYFRRPDRRFTRSWRFFNSRVAESYNTHGAVVQAAHTKAKEGPYAGKGKPSSGSRRSGSVLEGHV